MGRNQRSYTARLAGAPGLTDAEAQELDGLIKWITEKEYRQGNIGYTVHHQRRDELIAKRDGITITPEPGPESTEALTDDAD